VTLLPDSRVGRYTTLLWRANGLSETRRRGYRRSVGLLALTSKQTLLSLCLQSLEDTELLLLLLLLLLLVRALLDRRSQKLRILRSVLCLRIFCSKLLGENVTRGLGSISGTLNITAQEVSLRQLAVRVGTDNVTLAEKLGIQAVYIVENSDACAVLPCSLKDSGNVTLREREPIESRYTANRDHPQKLTSKLASSG
jgi:hypothetical protein